MTMTEKKPFEAKDLETEISETGQDTTPEENNETELSKKSHETVPENPEVLLKKEAEDLKDQLLRALAEAENTRKRAQKDREEASQYAITNFARDMLSVQDNLQRALESVQSGKEGAAEEISEKAQKALLEGVTMTAEALESTLKKHGIQEVSPLHTPFDSNFHQAMFEEETDDHVPGTVTQVLQTGYTLKERLLRPAMVGVAKKKP
ncbi:MAG: nucleotide exchange factor GrpE [bacterium]|nr:nucleotide exchange factor GrpE [bacterium]